MMNNSFQVETQDPGTFARRGRLQLTHGVVNTPAFMPVGTQASIKGLLPEQVAQSGAEIVLGNTYHLNLRPTSQRIAALGGLHKFMNWHRPILTDSGGFQIFSLSDVATISEQEAIFKSHIDGSTVRLSPETSIAIQENLGSDIAMQLDHLVALPNEQSLIWEACQRSIRWAERCKVASKRNDQCLFGIVQGGLDTKMRVWSAEQLIQIGFDGYAVGGLSVGETQGEMLDILKVTCPVLPNDRPRYLMGVGTPSDLLESIALGIDMFDCVMPTRNGRNAMAFTSHGQIKIRNAKHQDDVRPLDENCQCIACTNYSRAYLRHMFQAKEMLGPMLLSLHNLTYYQSLMRQAREAIEQKRYLDFLSEYRERFPSSSPLSQTTPVADN
jgi:queuine tRNA-ribosyltransferase